MSTDTTLKIWTPSDVVSIPHDVESPDEIVKFGSQTLTQRDMRSITAAFQSQSYEMVSTFVWTKAAITLKRQVATLGMDFVGEMLGRPDLTDDSDPAASVGDHEAIALAEDLGMITSTQALRLKQALDLVTHFATLDQEQGNEESMTRLEAVSLLRTCITSILGKPRFEVAVQFADFRRRLGESTLTQDDSDVTAIKTSPYFFIRTTLSVLLSMVKTSKGATFEHAIGNTRVLVPLLWDVIRQPEKWQIGQVYAEVTASGNRMASVAIKRALMEVRGFDFVPESLRSSTFTEASAKVLSSHFASNNFYNERQPMEALANLGTSIPMPAFAKCVEAALAVYLGNRWGHTWDAQPAATALLGSLQPTKWEYYLNECLPRDRTVLDKLSEDQKPLQRWVALVTEYLKSEPEPRDLEIKKLLQLSRGKVSPSRLKQIQTIASRIRSRLGE